MANQKDPKEVAAKFVRRTQAATQDMIAGVNAVTVNPAQEAIKKQDKMLNNLTIAVQEGKWKRGLGRVTLEDWKASMINKGASRVAAGVQAAQGKMEAFYSELLPYQAELQKKIDAMPDTTLQDGINRAVQWMTDMNKFRRRG